MDATWLDKLNPQQRAAATAGNDPLLIIAGAGTGKTNTLAHRVAYLISQGTSPSRILLLTFTRRAASEMLKRVEGILCAQRRGGAAKNLSQLWGGTFHAMSHRLLRLYADSLGLGDNFTIIDRSDAEDVVGRCRAELGFDKGDVRFPRKSTCLSIYSRCVNASEPLDVALKTSFPWCAMFPEQLKQLFRAYTQRKREENTLDYDDLLLIWHQMMLDESLAADVRQRFDAVLVDEYQDTNKLQADTLRLLCPTGKGLTVVGDDAQSIYSFRAATVQNILDFPRQFPGAVVQKLEQNYRSVQPILAATNAIICLSPQRHEKQLFSLRPSAQKPRLITVQDEEQQCEHLIQRILEHHEAGIALKKQAVLFRAAHHSDALEVALTQRNIPFVKYGGLKFLEAAHVKDVICILRFAENLRDSTSAARVLQLLDGFGPSHTRRALDHLQQHPTLAGLATFDPPAAAQWPAFLDLMHTLKGGGLKVGSGASNQQDAVDTMSSSNPQPPTSNPQSLPLPEQLASITRFYSPILEKRYENADMRRRDLEQLELISGQFASRVELLSNLALDPPSATQDLAGPPTREEDNLVLSTIHSAKGCEWDCVYVIHAADGNIPSDMATGSPDQVEEERRLFYVALTRAKDFLEVTFPLRYYVKGRGTSDRHSYAQLTRFIPESLAEHFEKVMIPPRPSTSPAVAAGGRIDVRGAISAMWT